MRALTFGVSLRGSAFSERVRQAEDLGVDLIAVADHLGAPDPFVLLSAAAQITSRLRLRTYVLNVGFWNPALLTRAAATIDLLSAGRLELGLGAGSIPDEHEDAGLPWPKHSARIAQLEHTLAETRRRLSDPDHQPPPVQHPVPIAVGAMTTPGLRLAAEHADIVAFSGLLQRPKAPAGQFTVASSTQTKARVDEVRQHAAGRAYRSDALLQVIRFDTDPRAAAQQLAREWGNVTPEQLLDTPFVLLAHDPAHAAAILQERSETYGFSSYVTHEPNLVALGQVIAAV